MPATKKKATASSAKKAKPKSEPTKPKKPQVIVFENETLLAVTPKKSNETYSIVKLKQDVTEDDSENIEVVFLQRPPRAKESILTEKDHGHIAIKDIICDVGVEKVTMTGKGSKKIGKYQISVGSFAKIRRLTANFHKEEHDEDADTEKESADESEEDQEEETKGSKRGKAKKVVQRKSQKNGKKDMEEEEEETEEEEESEEEEEKKGKRGRPSSKAKKEESASKTTKKVKKEGGAEAVTKTEKLDSKKEGKESKTKTTKSKGKPKYKKGKENPLVEIVEKNELLENPSNKIVEYGSIREKNRNILRAVNLKNHKLLKEILESENVFSSHYKRYAPENDFNAFDLAVANNDHKSLEALLKYEKSYPKPRLAKEPPFGIDVVDTGHNSIYTFGVRVRKIQTGRGNKEGNNALLAEPEDEEFLNETSKGKIMKTCTDTEALDMIRTYLGEDFIETTQIIEAIRHGNCKLAGHLIGIFRKRGGYGFNILHEDVLVNSDHKKLPHLRKTSVIKKSTGNPFVTPMHCAAINPNPKILETLFATEPNYSIADDMLRKPMHYAAACEGPGPLKMLLDKGADSKEVDRLGCSPLMIAAERGRVKNVELLLEEERSVINAKNKDGMMAIHLAAMNGHLDCLKMLVDHGAEINAPGAFRMTPLHWAAAHGHYKCVEFLLDSNAKLLARDKFRRNPLIMACRNGNVKVASLLLQRGADFNDPDSSKNYAVHYAAAYAFPQCFELLIQAGADPNITNSWNISPLAIAMLKNNNGTMRKILDSPGTDVNCKDEGGRTIISTMLDTLNETNFESIKFLIEEKKADPNIPDLKNNTPLHYICKSSNHAMNYNEFEKLRDKLIDLLLEHGADVNHANDEGKTVFSYALERNNRGVMKCLLAKLSKELNLAFIDKNQRNLLHQISSLITDEDGIEFFWDLCNRVPSIKDFVNLYDNFGYTPIHLLVQTFNHSWYSNLVAAYNKYLGELRENKNEQWHKENPTPEGTERKNPPTYYPNSEEITELQKRAVENTNKYVDKFIKTLEKLVVGLGANLALKVEKKFEFRKENLKEKIVTEEDEQEKLIRKTRLAKKGQVQIRKDAEYGPHGLQTILHLVSVNPNPRMLEYIFELKSFDINAKDFLHQTPFYLFCKTKKDYQSIYFTTSADILKSYLNHGADPNIPDLNDHYPMHELSSKNDTVFMQLLVDHKAKINILNRKGESPLLDAIKKNIATVEFVLKLGADPNFTDQMGRSALHHAINNNREDVDTNFQIEKLLIRYKADINMVDRRGRTPLHYAFVKIGNPFEKNASDPIETVSSLLEIEGCKADLQDSLGATPLHLAAQRGAYISCLTLINKKVPIDLVDKFGNTPLANALKYGQSGVATLLVQSGANVCCKVHINLSSNPFIIPEKKMEIETQAKNPFIKYDDDNDENDEEEEAELEEDEIQSEEGEEEAYIEQRIPEVDTKNYDGFFMEDKEAFDGIGQWSDRRYSSKYRNNIAVPRLDLPAGEHSCFTIAIKRTMQGVTYLLVQKGYPLDSAIHDSINEQKFKYTFTLLTKVQDGEVLKWKNQENQTIVHSFARLGRKTDYELSAKILDEIFYWKINLDIMDDAGCTALHHAASSNFDKMLTRLLENGADPNIQNKEHQTAFSILLKHYKTSWMMDQFIKHKTNIAVKFQHTVFGKKVLIGPVAFLAFEGSKEYSCYKKLFEAGVSVNDADENGVTALMYAIKENSKKLVAFLLEQKDLDLNMRDKSGKTPIHYVVNPVDSGSYENVAILNLLKDKFDINAKDDLGRPPIFYAYLQDSGVFVEALKNLGAVDARPPFNRQPTSILSTTAWSDHEVDFEEDSELFIKKSKEIDDKIMAEEAKHKKPKALVDPDPNINNRDNCEVYVDPVLGPYHLVMTRVDVRMGGYSLYLFYRMQVVHEKNRDVYVLFTRWGRIGETGAYQQTPFASKEECIKEFHKIFKQKSGNEWENKDNFKKVFKKYQLHKLEENRGHAKDYFLPYDLNNPKIPRSELPEEVQYIMKAITSVKMYQRAFETLHIDRETFPLANISRDLILEARGVLGDIKDLLEQKAKVEADNAHPNKLNSLLELAEQIADKSSRFYELIPVPHRLNEPIRPIDNFSQLSQKTTMVDQLFDYEQAIKIILGSMHNLVTINPLDYCFNALNIRALPLTPETSEYGIVKMYLNNAGTSYKIRNIFAVERKGEAERFAPYKNFENRLLLWHGTKLTNFMGILSQGLRIAPPEAAATGYNFGKGIYFADIPSKSYSYAYDNVTSGSEYNFRMMLLCEVALGEMKKLHSAEYIENLGAPYNSVMGTGFMSPNPKQHVILANGAKVPCGKVINLRDKLRKKNPKDETLFFSSYNEYIVYKTEQVRIRYVVQLD